MLDRFNCLSIKNLLTVHTNNANNEKYMSLILY